MCGNEVDERAAVRGNSCTAKLNGAMTNGCKCGKGKGLSIFLSGLWELSR